MSTNRIFNILTLDEIADNKPDLIRIASIGTNILTNIDNNQLIIPPPYAISYDEQNNSIAFDPDYEEDLKRSNNFDLDVENFIAPEIRIDGLDHSAESAFYSFGMLLFYLLSGKNWFDYINKDISDLETDRKFNPSVIDIEAFRENITPTLEGLLTRSYSEETGESLARELPYILEDLTSFEPDIRNNGIQNFLDAVRNMPLRINVDYIDYSGIVGSDIIIETGSFDSYKFKIGDIIRGNDNSNYRIIENKEIPHIPGDTFIDIQVEREAEDNKSNNFNSKNDKNNSGLNKKSSSVNINPLINNSETYERHIYLRYKYENSIIDSIIKLYEPENKNIQSKFTFPFSEIKTNKLIIYSELIGKHSRKTKNKDAEKILKIIDLSNIPFNEYLVHISFEVDNMCNVSFLSSKTNKEIAPSIRFSTN